jgi:AcrR family transcriptional regulator
MPTHTPVPAAARTMPPSARERILHTAHELFYREGIRATGVDRVIAEAGVTKVTFYRHFPSKNDLVQAFLAFRHERWMHWFTDALARQTARGRSGVQAVAEAMSEWFAQDDFRGCAFINAVVELGGSQPEVAAASQSHKQAMAKAIRGLLPPSRHRKADADAIAMAVDGAIVRAQYAQTPSEALAPLKRLLQSFA